MFYGVVLFAGTAGDRKYAEWFRSVSRNVFGSIVDNGAVGFVALKKPEQPKFTTEMRLANKREMENAMNHNKQYRSVMVTLSSWYTGYLPTMLTIALLLAIPGLALPKKALALLGGMVVIHLFIFVKLYIQILYEFERNEWLQVVQFSPSRQQVMDKLFDLLVQSMGLNFAMPVVICLAVMLLFKNSIFLKIQSA